jgi:hypothetical protein
VEASNSLIIQRLHNFYEEKNQKDWLENKLRQRSSKLRTEGDNVELIIFSQMQWLCQELNIKHPHDLDAEPIERSLIENLDSDKLDKMAELLDVAVFAKTSKKGKKIETLLERKTDFLNRVFSLYGSKLVASKKRHRKTVDGKKIDFTPFICNPNYNFYKYFFKYKMGQSIGVDHGGPKII